MPSYSAGQAFITVAPNLRGFETKVSSYLKTHLRPVLLDVNPNVDDAKAKAELKDLARDRKSNVRVDLDDRSARSRLSALIRPRRMTVNVDADTSAATARIAALRGGSALGGAVAGGALLAAPVGAGALGVGAAGATALAGAGGAGAIFGAGLVGQIVAMKKASKEMQTLGKHVDSLTKGTAEYRQQSKLLTEQQKQFNQQFGPASRALITLGGAWRRFLSGTRGQSMAVITNALGIVSKLLPKLVPIANEAGRSINGVLTMFGNFVNGPEGKQVLAFFQNFGSRFITQFGTIGLNLFKGLFNILIAFAPLTVKIGDAMARGSRAFADWTKNLGKSDGFKSFVGYIQDNGPKALSLLGDMGKVIGRVVVALAPIGGQLLTGVARLFKLLANAPTPVVLGFTVALVALVSPVAAIVLGVAALATVLEHAYKSSAGFRKAVDSLANAFKPLLPQIRSLLKPLRGLFVAFVGLVTVLWRKFGKDITRFLVLSLSGLIDIVRGILKIITGVFKLFTDILRGNWKGVWRDLGLIVSGAWDIIKGLLRGGFAAIRLLFTIQVKLLKAIWSGLWTGMKKLAKAGMDLLWRLIRNGAADIVDFFLGFAEKLLKLASFAFGWIPGLKGPLKDASKAFAKFRDDVNRYLRGIHDRHVHVVATVSAARIAKVTAQLARSGGGFATGGLVRGPGGPRDDAILARLSNREYVNTAATVNREGAHNFDLLNKGRATIVPRFAQGGLVVSTAGTDASGAKDTARVGDRIVGRIASLLGIGLVRAMDRIIGRLSAVTGGLHGRSIPIGHGYYRPVSGPVTRGLHDSWTGFPALDLAGPVGRPVFSVAPGRVAASYDIRGYEPRRYGAQDGYRSYGRVIQIRHNGFSTLYAHLSRRGVRAGQAVAGGTVIGLSGNTGNSTGPHLHFGSAGVSPWTFMGGATGGHLAFDRGGIARGAGYIPKNVIGPERVLTTQQTRSFDRLVGALERGRGSGLDVHNTYEKGSIVVRSQKELAAGIAREQTKKLVRLTR
jgi:murein DD-endopeptidase MepM/ murein hydrolase activator NlpD